MIKKNDILVKVDWDVLNKYIDENLIVANKHPEYDIWILNYSPKAQSKRVWNEYTLACRGLVIDADGNILARPFGKFKNIEEYDESEIPSDLEFDVFEKMDGSLIIIFYYEPYKEWIVASRGSFISEQAEEANKMVTKATLSHLKKNCTYLFEVIYPQNRIVVDYGMRRELVLLARVGNDNAGEPFYNEMVEQYSKYFTIVKKLDIKTLPDLLKYKALDKDNEEGVVVRFSNGFRMKCKFEEYVRLHGILTNVSNLTVWEHLMNDFDFDELMDRVPDEFYAWLNKTKAKIQCDFNEIERLSLKEFVRIIHVNKITDRKQFADQALASDHCSILFKMYDAKSYDTIIWKMIRPTFSKPFAHGYEILP